MHPSLLGWSRTFTHDGMHVEIKLPAGPGDFAATINEQQQEGLPAAATVVAVGTITEPNWDNATVAVRVFGVSVRLERDLPPDRPDNPLEGGQYRQLAEAACREGQTICDEVARDFLRWLRASTRQPWLGLIAAPLSTAAEN